MPTSASDFLTNPSGTPTALESRIANNLGAYLQNQRQLSALGIKDPAKSNKGLLDAVLAPLSGPANLIRGGIAEATGMAQKMPQLNRQSGLNEFFNLLSGKTRVGFGDIPALQTKQGEGVLPRIGKLGVALAGDIVTDPLSYIGAPAAISRKAASTTLILHTLKDDSPLLAKVIETSTNKNLLKELADSAPTTAAAKIQSELKLTAESGTPLEVVAKMGQDKLAKQTLANYLAEGLYGGGRKEVINRLEKLVGNREEAIKVYDTLPEQVKGGVVITGPLGRPITDADGKMIRLTQGHGEFAGSEYVNKLRLAASNSMPANFFKNYMSGEAGDIYKAATKRIAEESPLFNKQKQIELAKTGLPPFADSMHKQRLVDYVISRGAAKDRGVLVNKLQGKSKAVVESALQRGSVFGENGATDRNAFDKALEDAFFAPHIQTTYTDEASKQGQIAGMDLRNHMNELYTYAKDEGIDIGQIGSMETWSPLMYTKETFDKILATEKGRMLYDSYNPLASRESFIRYFNDPKVAAAHGYAIDPENPNIVALDARRVNEVLGKEEGVNQRLFETDPLKVFTTYSEIFANKIGTRRFLNDLVYSGVGIMDSPLIDRAITKAESAMLQDVTAKLYPGVKEILQTKRDEALKELQDLINPKAFKQVKDEINNARVKAKDEYDTLKALEINAIAKVDELAAQISIISPRIPKLKKTLDEYGNEFTRVETDLNNSDSLFRSLRERLRRADAKLVGNEEKKKMIQEELSKLTATADNAELIKKYTMLSADLETDTAQTLQKIADSTSSSEMAQEALASARQDKELLTTGTAEQLKKDYNEYLRLLEEHSMAVNERERLRGMRGEAWNRFDATKNQIALEGKNTIDAMVENYRLKQYQSNQADILLSDTVKDMARKGISDVEINAYKKEQAPILKQLKDEAAAMRRVVRDTLGYTTGRFGEVVSDYAKNVLTATDKLNAAEFQAFKILRNGDLLEQHIYTIANSNRNSAEVFQAMHDINNTYLSMRNLIPEDAYNALAESERKFMDEYTHRTLKQSTRVKETASPLANALVEKGYAVSAATPSTANFFVNSGVKKWLDELYNTNKNPNSWQRYVSDVIDPLLQLWKQTVTVGRGPGFVATNLSGGLFMNYQGGVTLDEMKMSGKAISLMRKTMADVKKEFPSNPISTNMEIVTQRLNDEFGKIKYAGSDLGTLFQEFYQRGAFNDTETHFGIQQIKKAGGSTPESVYTKVSHYRKDFDEQDIGRVETKYRQFIDFATTNRVQSFLNDMNQTSELYMRFGAFLSGYKEYGDYTTAMNKVYLLHFDYNDLTSAEHSLRRLAPFYTWTRNNVPAQFRNLMMQPGKIQRAMYFNTEFRDKFGEDGPDSWVNQVLPEWMQNANGFYSNFGFGDTTLGFTSKMPYEDLNKMFQISDKGAPMLRKDAITSSLGPFGTPMQLASGVDYTTGQPLNQDVTVPTSYLPLALVPFSGVRVKNGEVVMSGGANLTLNQAAPLLGVAQKTASALNFLTGDKAPQYVKDFLMTKQQQNSGISSLLNTTGISNILGYTAVTGTQKSFGGTLYGKVAKQDAAMSSAIKSLGIDTKWLNEQISKGMSDSEIQILIRSGQAQKAKDKKLSPEASKKALKAIAFLNSPQ